MHLPSDSIWSLLLLALSAGSSFGQGALSHSLLPAGLADPSGKSGFLANSTGGLDVVDLASGDLLWETKEAPRPILVHGERLYAQAAVGRNGLRMLAFDLVENGPCVLQSQPVWFPEWVNVREGPGRSFKAHWKRERNRLVLTWEAAAWNEGPPLFRLTGKASVEPGKANPPVLSNQVEALEAPSTRRQAAGKVAFDLETGQIEGLPYEPESLSAPPRAPDGAAKLVVRWQRESGGIFTALTLDAAGGQQALVLRTWDRVTGKPSPPKELLRGQRLVVLPTVDERLLCLREVSPSPDRRPATEQRAWRFGWSIFAPEMGNLVGQLPFEPGTQAVAIVGPRAYFLVAGPLQGSINREFVRPQTLKAVDAKTGKILWERPVEGKRCLPPGA